LLPLQLYSYYGSFIKVRAKYFHILFLFEQVSKEKDLNKIAEAEKQNFANFGFKIS